MSVCVCAGKPPRRHAPPLHDLIFHHKSVSQRDVLLCSLLWSNNLWAEHGEGRAGALPWCHAQTHRHQSHCLLKVKEQGSVCVYVCVCVQKLACKHQMDSSTVGSSLWATTAQTWLRFAYSVIHTHIHTHTYARPNGSPSSDPWWIGCTPAVTDERWMESREDEGKKGMVEEEEEVGGVGWGCVHACAGSVGGEKKSWVQWSWCQGGSYTGAKQIISSSAARVISSKQTALLWTWERLKVCPVNLSPLSSASASLCPSLSPLWASVCVCVCE